jgi:hypothetical protein
MGVRNANWLGSSSRRGRRRSKKRGSEKRWLDDLVPAGEARLPGAEAKSKSYGPNGHQQCERQQNPAPRPTCSRPTAIESHELLRVSQLLFLMFSRSVFPVSPISFPGLWRGRRNGAQTVVRLAHAKRVRPSDQRMGKK